MHRGRYFATATYFDRLFNARAVKILPGEYHANATNTIITTVLGSCVSVCLYDCTSGIGGMNHYMLPRESGHTHGSGHGSARYGNHAMDLLLEHVIQLGAVRCRLEAKVLGAGRVIEGMADVGSRNSAFALQYLKEKDIRIRALDLGSIFPRKVCFCPASGRVFVRRIRNREFSADLFPFAGSSLKQ